MNNAFIVPVVAVVSVLVLIVAKWRGWVAGRAGQWFVVGALLLTIIGGLVDTPPRLKPLPLIVLLVIAVRMARRSPDEGEGRA